MKGKIVCRLLYSTLIIILLFITHLPSYAAHGVKTTSENSEGNSEYYEKIPESLNLATDDDVISSSNNARRDSIGSSLRDGGKTEESGDTPRIFLREIFTKYGEGGRMTFEGFEHLLVNLGLGNVWIDDHDVHDHHTGDGFSEFHEDHNHNITRSDSRGDTKGQVSDSPPGQENMAQEGKNGLQDGLSNSFQVSEGSEAPYETENGGSVAGRGPEVQSTISEENSENYKASGRRVDEENNKRKRRHVSKDSANKCLSPQEILQAAHIKLNFGGISPSEFSSALCPAIIYQLDAHVCHSHEPCDQAVSHQTKAAHCSLYHHCRSDQDHDHGSSQTNRTIGGTFTLAHLFSIPGKVWGMALVAVTVISLCGLCSVAIIPIMDRLFYNQLLQFLISLAVGTLTGDAMLHLLPHAMLPHSDAGGDVHEGTTHNDVDEERLIWCGLTVLSGIYFFFLMERFVSVYGNWKKKRTARRKQLEKLKGIGDHHHHHHHHHHHQHHHREAEKQGDEEQRLESSQSSEEPTEMTMMQVDFPSRDPDNNIDPVSKGHGHGHSHSVPGSVSAAAWMVIMGDGLHNFTDGLAIGASFSNSISVGLSTSVAVFCHELPHELGDFAVLLKAGMSVKQALVYNIVSSVLCLLGMFLGLLLGNIESASVWIFTITAGIFVYIALVDMLPEMTGSIKEDDIRGSLITLLLHSVGLASGVVIMLLIALFEDNIQILAGENL